MAPKAGKARETIVMVQSILLLLHAQSLWQPFWESIDGRGKWTWVLSACCSTLRKFFLTSMSARLTKALVQDVWGRFQPDTTSHFLLSLSDVLLGGPRFLHRSQPSEVRGNLHKELITIEPALLDNNNNSYQIQWNKTQENMRNISV